MSLSGSEQSSEEDSLLRATCHVRTVFLCGFVAKRWHNSALHQIAQDLLPDYFVCCNGNKWLYDSNTRALLVNAEAFIFFVNEFTLADSTCLLALQHAWHLMIPIIMLRPPRTKLVICARNAKREEIKLNEGNVIAKHPNSLKAYAEAFETNKIDYPLLQDILYEGYRFSTTYDRLNHRKSMEKILARLEKIIPPLHSKLKDDLLPVDRVLSNKSSKSTWDLNTNSSDSRSTYLGNYIPELSKAQNLQTPATKERETIRQCKSAGNLSKMNEPTASERKTVLMKKRLIPKPIKISNIHEDLNQEDLVSQVAMSRGPPLSSVESFSMSFDRSMSSLDDFSNYTSTQYLVFPIQDKSKKPVLVRFPEDLVEEEHFKDGSVWGSDTSLEEEAEIAPRIRGEIERDIDYEDDSPIMSPAPYMESLA